MNPRPFVTAVWTVLAVSVSATIASAKDYRITLSSAAVDRAGQVITFPLPKNAPKDPCVVDATGTVLPLQVDASGHARFVMPWQAAGTTGELDLRKSPKKSSATRGVAVATVQGDLALSVDGTAALGYRMDASKLPRADIKPEYKRAGYLYPIYSPAGKLVADDYPVQHIHHHGIWSPWTKTSFQGRKPDFWNMGQKTGTVELVGLDRTWSGAVHGGFVARHRMVDLSAPQPVTALNETWNVTVYAVPGASRPVRLFDLVITQTCATSDPLILPEYRYGGLGYRGPTQWFGEKNPRFLSANGETDRVKAHASRSTWISQYGAVEGGVAGLALLGHPDNFRAPQPLRVHPKEPFICFAPSQLGDWSIDPGKPYVARYRFVVADGEPDRALLEAYWQGYAHPATARLAAK